MELNKNHLSQEQIEVTQNCGTEPPFSGELLYEKREGIYSCIVCDFSLFESDTKFGADLIIRDFQPRKHGRSAGIALKPHKSKEGQFCIATFLL